jgi:hypothetical protein
MARIRTIKPAFFRHKGLYELEQSSGFPMRVGFAGLWTVADREGRFRWRPEELKLDCLPYDQVDFAEVLAALQTAGFVQKYVVDGKAFGVIPSFAEHQIVNSREAQSTLPEPGGMAITCNSHGEGKGREGKGTGTDGSSEALTRSEPDSPIVLVFPTIGPNGLEWRLRRVQVDEWRTAYPGIDVVAECRRAWAWVKANPGRRKTARGMPKFLLSWLSRAVDSGRVIYEAPEAPAPKPSQQDDWFQECQVLHNLECGGSSKHRLRMQIEADKAAARAAS